MLNSTTWHGCLLIDNICPSMGCTTMLWSCSDERYCSAIWDSQKHHEVDNGTELHLLSAHRVLHSQRSILPYHASLRLLLLYEAPIKLLRYLTLLLLEAHQHNHVSPQRSITEDQTVSDTRSQRPRSLLTRVIVTSGTGSQSWHGVSISERS